MAGNRKKTGVPSTVKGIILLVVFGVPLAFAALTWSTKDLISSMPLLVLGVVLVGVSVYNSYTVSLLYKYFDEDMPILGYIPCLCETFLMDYGFRKICYILYPICVAFLGLSQLPYEIISIMGTDFATTAPFYFMVISLLAGLGIQIIKGIGLWACFKAIEDIWNQRVGGTLGMLKYYLPIAFLPIVRVVFVYTLNKPLATLVTFRGETVNTMDSDDALVESHEDTKF